MKTYFLHPSLLLIAAIAISSCSNNNDIERHINYFAVGQELKIPLTKGVIIDSGKIPNVSYTAHLMNVDFMDEGVAFDPYTNTFSGIGNRVNIKFIVPEDRLITTGTYTFNSVDTIPFTNVTDSIPFTFNSGFVEENYDYTNLTGHHHVIIGGTLIVISDGFNYDFTLNCSLSTGFNFVGTFKGNMTYYDLENLKK